MHNPYRENPQSWKPYILTSKPFSRNTIEFRSQKCKNKIKSSTERLLLNREYRRGSKKKKQQKTPKQTRMLFSIFANIRSELCTLLFPFLKPKSDIKERKRGLNTHAAQHLKLQHNARDPQ